MKDSAHRVLARQRQALVAQIGGQRTDLARRAEVLRSAARMIDRLNAGLRQLKKHPEILLLPLAITVASDPRRRLAWGFSVFGLWRLLQGWRRWGFT